MGFMDALGKAQETVKGLASLEAKQDLLRFTIEAQEIYSENRRLEQENRDLAEKLRFHGTLKFDRNVLWSSDSAAPGPFCNGCWQGGTYLKVNLTTQADLKWYKCPKCGERYDTDPGHATREWKAQSMRGPND